MTNIHPLSVVHPNANIGENVTIDPFAVIQDDVVIGNGTHVMSHSIVMPGTRVGKDCKIFPNAVVGAIPQDLKFKDEYTTLEIGDRVTIRECATINRGTKAYGKTVIGNDCLIMAYVHVAHDCVLGNHVVLVNNVNLAGHVEIGDYAVLGGLSAVHQFVKIGAHSMVGGGALVRKDIPPYIRVSREPLRYVGVNSIGLKRRGFSDEIITQIQKIYRCIFVDNNNIFKSIADLNTLGIDTEEKTNIINFLHESDRGIVKGFRQED